MERKDINEAKPKVITKLAIGLPGGVDAEADKWETTATAHCLPCKHEFSKEDSQVASMVQSVMLANSAFNESTVTEWQLDLSACAHTKNLNQEASSRIAEMKLAHCG